MIFISDQSNQLESLSSDSCRACFDFFLSLHFTSGSRFILHFNSQHAIFRTLNLSLSLFLALLLLKRCPDTLFKVMRCFIFVHFPSFKLFNFLRQLFVNSPNPSIIHFSFHFFPSYLSHFFAQSSFDCRSCPLFRTIFFVFLCFFQT